MSVYSRRAFLGRVGTGMLASAGGVLLANELDLLGFLHAKENERLEFGALEPLVDVMQDLPADALMDNLKARLDKGTSLQTMVAAAALANARTFGGQDYTGYHCFMALVPAVAMSRRLSGKAAALPVFKVLHRNATRIQAHGGRRDEVLALVAPREQLDGKADALLLAAGRAGGFDTGEATLARVAAAGPAAAFAALQPLVRDNIDVHQVVLAYRSWDMMQMTGETNGRVLLRQVLRQCIDRDENRRRRGRAAPSIRELLPRLVDEHRLDREIVTKTRLSPSELDAMATLLFSADRDDAASHVAERLAAGVSRDDIGEALSLAAVRLLTHDPGRSTGETGKPAGSVHGASVGLHAADSANAWRGIAAATTPANANASLVTGAWHTAGQSSRMRESPHHASARESAAKVPASDLLEGIAGALREGDQRRSCALVERYGSLDRDPDALLDLLLEPAIAHDGALHHEKFFHTASIEFARTRPEARWEHLVALTRVMASGNGFEAQGLDVARAALGIES